MEVVRDLRTLKALEKRSDWQFDSKYKYHIGKTYCKTKKVNYKNNTYSLQYSNGCFYPYCIKVV
jgi:hypothetical protein